MIAKPLFRKNYFLFSGIIVLCVTLFSVFSFLIKSINREKMVPPHHEAFMRLLESSGDPIQTLAEYERTEKEPDFIDMEIVDANGLSLLDGKQVLDGPLTEDQLSKIQKGESIFRAPNFGMGSPGFLISSLRSKKGFFVTRPNPRRTAGGFGIPRGPPGPPGPPGPFPIFMTSLLSFIVCILASVGIAMLIFFSNYRKRAEEALAVLKALQSGDLNARMPNGKLDELAPLTNAFNQMADEIQHLFETLKRSDRARRRLLQDLAHDLRTPLASLRTFIETIRDRSDRINEEKRKEILQLCLSEIEYFSQLVEDLLFLAQISEPKYSLDADRVDLKAEIDSQLSVLQNRMPQIKFESVVEGDGSPVITGSAKLISRLMRNALVNASHFARKSVIVTLRSDQNHVVVQVSDDGPGFSEKALSEFGVKKASRVLSGDGDQKRISVGIGSVIMREIAQLHSGSLRAENKIYDGKVAGAHVYISLK